MKIQTEHRQVNTFFKHSSFSVFCTTCFDIKTVFIVPRICLEVISYTVLMGFKTR